MANELKNDTKEEMKLKLANEIMIYTEKTFEDIKHIDEYGNEFWYARELQVVLEYKQWRRFEQVIEKARRACQNSKMNVFNDFADVGKIVKAGATTKNIVDIKDYIMEKQQMILQKEKD